MKKKFRKYTLKSTMKNKITNYLAFNDLCNAINHDLL